MQLTKATLLALFTAALSVQAQSHYLDDRLDLFARSYNADDDLFELFGRSAEAEPEPELDDDSHLLLTRDLHARVAELEDVISVLAARTDNKNGGSSNNQQWKSPTVPGTVFAGVGGKGGSFARTGGKVLEMAGKSIGGSKPPIGVNSPLRKFTIPPIKPAKGPGK